MLQIFWGFIFLLFDINISLYSIDILPDFIGWILLFCGTYKLLQNSKVFTCVKISVIFMSLVSLMQYVISFMGSSNFVYAYISGQFGVKNADFAYVLTNVFWGLKLIVLTLSVFALFKMKDTLRDTKRVIILRNVWLIILIIEIATFLFNNFIAYYFPNTMQKAIIQVLVVGVIFFKIWFIFSVYKIKCEKAW